MLSEEQRGRCNFRIGSLLSVREVSQPVGSLRVGVAWVEW